MRKHFAVSVDKRLHFGCSRKSPPYAVAAIAGFLPTTTLDNTTILLSRLLWPRDHHGL